VGDPVSGSGAAELLNERERPPFVKAVQRGPSMDGEGSRTAIAKRDRSNLELRISARILVHIARQPRLAISDDGLQSLTQAGMAVSLRTTSASVSHPLGRLVASGLVVVGRRRVAKRYRRVWVYQLTPEGERMADRILSSMASHSGKQAVSTEPVKGGLVVRPNIDTRVG
jgi:DNA-binding MarR family transcriptional regulator